MPQGAEADQKHFRQPNIVPFVLTPVCIRIFAGAIFIKKPDYQLIKKFSKMTLKNFLPFAALLFAVISCTAQPDTNAKTFGAPVNASGAISYEELLTKMASAESMPAKVKGKVSEVCQKKGCWMTLVSEQPGQPEMRVTFKDYAFFMPKNIVGKHVVIEGNAAVETTSVDVLRHYAEDAKKSKEEIEAIKEPKRELSFEAAGVLITD